MEAGKTRRHALVLTGGGARAAYQVGALCAMAKITASEVNPFKIISGYSAGAINGVWLAARSESFSKATQSLWEEWSRLTIDQIFNTNIPNVSLIAMKWIVDRLSGGMNGHRQIAHLLDASPLQNFIKTHIDFKALNQNLLQGKFHAVSVTAASYTTGHSTTFFGGHSAIEGWHKLNRISRRAELTAEHVLASSAIPIFFPPVRIGSAYYGDGMVRLNAPLSAAIRLGAESLLVVGIRGPSAITHAADHASDYVTLGEIAGTILNGLFFDALDADIARMERINRTLSLLAPDELQRQRDSLRRIPLLVLKPSQEIGELPSCEMKRFPATLRFLLKGLGLRQNRGTDLLSYLSFEPSYIRSLLELGYEDTLARKDEVLEFLNSQEARAPL